MALLVSGCANVPRVVHLQSPDDGAASPICIKVEPFSDSRVDKKIVGVARNGFYYPIGTATTEDDAAKWIENHLRPSLFPEGCTADSEFAVEGRIRELFVNEWFNLNAKMVVTLRLTRGRTLVMERDIETTYGQLSHLGSGPEFEQTLKKALAVFGERASAAVIAAASDDQRPLPPGL
jgi:hypothetical protein